MSSTPPSPLSSSVDGDAIVNDTASRNAEKEMSEIEKDFSFYFILLGYNSCTPSIVHSPYHSFGGYLWRLVVYPRDTANGISVALECGGPTVVKKQWSVPVRHNLVLVHPSKWESFLGITDVHSPDQLSRRLYTDSGNNCNSNRKSADNGNNSGSQGTNGEKRIIIPPDIPPYDLHVTNTHTFSSTDYSLWDDEDEFAPFAILQPGMFTDDEFNLVVKAHIILDDFYNSVPLDESPAASSMGENNTVLGEEHDNAFDYLDHNNNLVQNLIARKELIDEVLNLDKKLLEVNQDVAKKALEKELRAIGDTLGKIDQPKDVVQKLMVEEEKRRKSSRAKKKKKKKFTPKKAINSCFSLPSSLSDSHSIPSIPRICVEGDL